MIELNSAITSFSHFSAPKKKHYPLAVIACRLMVERLGDRETESPDVEKSIRPRRHKSS